MPVYLDAFSVDPSDARDRRSGATTIPACRGELLVCLAHRARAASCPDAASGRLRGPLGSRYAQLRGTVADLHVQGLVRRDASIDGDSSLLHRRHLILPRPRAPGDPLAETVRLARSFDTLDAVQFVTLGGRGPWAELRAEMRIPGPDDGGDLRIDVVGTDECARLIGPHS